MHGRICCGIFSFNFTGEEQNKRNLVEMLGRLLINNVLEHLGNSNLDRLTIGSVLDMWTGRGNDFFYLQVAHPRMIFDRF